VQNIPPHWVVVKVINTDIAFKDDKIFDAVADKQIIMNWCSQKKHVPRIERKFALLRCKFALVRFICLSTKIILKVFVIGLVSDMTKWFKAFLTRNSIFQSYLPQTVVMDQKRDWFKDCQIEIGQAVETHNHPNGLQLSNIETPCTTSVIAIRSFSNLQGL